MKTLTDPDLEFFLARLEQIQEESYRNYVACNHTQPNIWFMGPEDEIASPVTLDTAMVCGSCPVLIECLDNAIYTEDQGVRSGTTEDERNRIVKHRVKYRNYFLYDTNFLEEL